MHGEEVAQIQQALISLGYLKGTADGVFGNNTENAVRKFQRKNKLTADGLVGTKTKELLLSKASGSSAPSESTSSSSGNDSAAASAGNASAARGSGNASSGSSLFSGNYATIKSGSRGARVRTLQNALIALNYLSGSADGSYGKKTKAAVIAFQQGCQHPWHSETGSERRKGFFIPRFRSCPRCAACSGAGSRRFRFN